ncbi:hypothetical protein IFM89_030564 [Coptis chinensis]|uniref:Uncharacterized protein n=1 Tax=Coptis chinensis TaxID=261450 RepID=A0A835HPN9_9MAGN|nr:hypothetical protein IFM89_030564 [Coptis chinensis]
MTEIEDLRDPHNLHSAPLCIKDLQQYFDSQQADSLRTLGDAEVVTKLMNLSLGTQKSFDSLKTLVSEMKENKFGEPVVRSGTALKDLQQYFDSQQADSLRTLGDAEVVTKLINLSLGTQKSFDSLKTLVSEMKENKFGEPVVRSGTALKVLNELTRQHSSAKYHICKSPQESVLDRLPKETRDDELLHHWASIQESLKHFWSSYPITTTYLSTKVSRLKDAMSEIYPKLQGVKESVQLEFRHQVSLLVHPMLKALDAAFLHYDAQTQRR